MKGQIILFFVLIGLACGLWYGRPVLERHFGKRTTVQETSDPAVTPTQKTTEPEVPHTNTSDGSIPHHEPPAAKEDPTRNEPKSGNADTGIPEPHHSDVQLNSVTSRAEMKHFLENITLNQFNSTFQDAQNFKTLDEPLKRLNSEWKGKIFFEDGSYWRLRLKGSFKDEPHGLDGSFSVDLKQPGGRTIHKTSAKGSIPYFRKIEQPGPQALFEIGSTYYFQIVASPYEDTLDGNFYLRDKGAVTARGQFHLERD